MSKLLLSTLIILFLSSSAYAATTVTKTVKSAGGDYTTLAAWEAGEQGDIVAADEIRQAECYASAAPDTTAVLISGWTTDATRYIRIYTPSSERHAGVYSTSKYRLEVTTAAASAIVQVNDSSYVRFEGIQFKIIPTANDTNYQCLLAGDGAFGQARLHVSNSIFVADNSGAVNAITYAIQLNGIAAGSHTARIWNNLFLDFANGYNTSSLRAIDTTTAYIYNNTFVNSYTGVRCSAGYGAAPTGLILKNNLFRSITSPAEGTYAAGTDYNATDAASMVYTVTGSGNANDRLSQTFTFANEAGDDFHITSADAGAKGYGVDLSADANLAFSDDIDSAARSAPWDIGMNEVASAAAVISVLNNITIKGSMTFK